MLPVFDDWQLYNYVNLSLNLQVVTGLLGGDFSTIFREILNQVYLSNSAKVVKCGKTQQYSLGSGLQKYKEKMICRKWDLVRSFKWRDYERSVLDWISLSAQSFLSLLNVPFIL